MSRIAMLSISLALLAGNPGYANLLVNGDFEQPMEVGWTVDTVNEAGDYRFEWSDTLGQPDAGSAARVYKYLARHATLSQTVDVPGTSLELDFAARLSLGGGSNTCWPVGAVVACYQDSTGAELGKTMVLLRTEFCTWVDGDTLHLIDVLEPGVWRQYRLDLGRELADYLTGINPADVARVRVELFAYDNGT